MKEWVKRDIKGNTPHIIQVGRYYLSRGLGKREMMFLTYKTRIFPTEIQKEVLWDLTENALSNIMTFCNLRMGDRIFHIDKDFFDDRYI